MKINPEIFGGLRPSRTAAMVVREANLLAKLEVLDPGEVVRKTAAAVSVAKEEGRKKVGKFGGAKPHIEGLEQVVFMAKSYGTYGKEEKW